MTIKEKRKAGIGLKIVLVVLCIVLLLGGGLFAKMKYEQSIMNPLATGEVIPGIYAVNNGFVNFFLIQKNDTFLMIDAGNNLRMTEQALKQLDISADAVETILLTHSDSDHVAALSLFTEAQIYLPAAEVQMIDGTTRRSPLGGNRLEYSYLTLADGQEIQLSGFEVRCTSTPGHTPGSMSFLIDGSFLFIGDTMSLQNGKAAPFNDFYNMDSVVQKNSIQKLAADISPAYIFTAHYGYSDDADMVFESWR